MIDHQYKCVFAAIPKTGGTSIIETFNRTWREIGNVTKTDKSKHPNIGRHAVQWPYWKHYKEKGYFVFTVVRNPWDRFISGWKYRKVKWKSARELLEDLPTMENDSKSYWHITATQTDMLYENGNCIADMVIRFEELQKGFDEVCDRIGKPKVILPHANKSVRESYQTYFTDEETKKLFLNHFQIDVDTFQYSF